jgi:rhamnosyltransferase
LAGISKAVTELLQHTYGTYSLNLELLKMVESTCAVIVSFNAPEELTACINSAVQQVDKIIIVDNSSENLLNDVIINATYSEKVEFIYNNTNKGLGYAFNQGLYYSIENHYEWTLLLDQDSILANNMIHELLMSYNILKEEEKSKTALLVPRVYDRNLEVELPAIISTECITQKITHPVVDTFVHFQISSGSLLRNEKIKLIGVMNDKLFIDYIDFEYCFRVLDSGHSILLCKNAFLYHTLGETTKKYFRAFIQHSPQRVFYQTRNRLYIIYKYGKKYKSIRNSEIVRFIVKLPKIIFLESQKVEKVIMYIKGIIAFAKFYQDMQMNKLES